MSKTLKLSLTMMILRLTTMRLAIVSDSGLPDARVEKEMKILEKMGAETFFVGPYRGLSLLSEDVLAGVIEVRWNRLARLGVEPYYHWVKKSVRRALSSIRPDLVVAVNIFAAIIVSELGYHLVFDDHEVYSLEVYCDKSLYEKSFMRKLVWRRKYEVFREWESKVSEVAPTIVVSQKAKEYYQNIGASRIFVIKNYPLQDEAPVLKKDVSCEEIKFSYIGSDIVTLRRVFRDMMPTLQVLDKLSKQFRLLLEVLGVTGSSMYNFVRLLGYVEHKKLYEHVSKTHAGLLTWRPVWFHAYANPNKAYIYAHSGSIPVISSSLGPVVEDLKSYAVIVGESNFEQNMEQRLKELLSTDSPLTVAR